jgi:hypothetical protein
VYRARLEVSSQARLRRFCTCMIFFCIDTVPCTNSKQISCEDSKAQMDWSLNNDAVQNHQLSDVYLYPDSVVLEHRDFCFDARPAGCEPFCLGPDNTIVRRKRQIVRQRREIQHELFSFPLARTTSCVQKKTRERTEPALYVCYETPSAQREPPLANWKQPVKQSNQALATAVALNFVYGLSVASKAT